MSKTRMIALVVAVLAVGGYFYFDAQKKAEMAEQAAATAAAEVKAAEDAAAKAAEEAAAKAAEEAKAAEDAAAKATEDAAAKVAEEAQAAQDAAAKVAEEASAALSAADFDMGKVTALLDSSDLAATVKAEFKAELEKVKDSPELLGAALEKIKAALGL